jgi:hypothetical protein
MGAYNHTCNVCSGTLRSRHNRMHKYKYSNTSTGKSSQDTYLYLYFPVAKELGAHAA